MAQTATPQGESPHHWVEALTGDLLKEKSPPFVITSGATTSGPCHLGTLCEFLFPSAIQKHLSSLGYETKFYFIGDILDAFDSVPVTLQKYEKELSPHFGKPLSDVPDPFGCCNSFGDHFLNELKDTMELLDIRPTVVSSSELYKKGVFDKYALLFLDREEEVKEVVRASSLKDELSKEWSPLMPICAQCGKIATTAVTSHTKDAYHYACSKDAEYVKGCGYEGEEKISAHRYKLTWRLHWPSWMDYFGTSLEGAGVDHHTRGGSWDTAVAVFKNIFRKAPPFGYKFGFVLFQGKKFSKSKGIGISLSDTLSLLPPEVVKYMLIKPDIQENIDLNPSTLTLLRLMDEFQEASAFVGKEDVTRAQRKMGKAFALSTNALNWKASFKDLLLYYQLYRDWSVVGEKLGDKEGVAYLKKYAENWLEKKFAPEEYLFSFSPKKPDDRNALEFLNALKEGMDATAVHNLVFETAKKHGVEPSELFKILYHSLIGKEKGPKLGKLITAIGIERVKQELL